MCIVIISTAHPDYPFILLSNRDEFVFRPTAPAGWWEPPHAHVLGGRDLERKERGTWLGITRQGRIAALTNFREEGAEKVALDKSRGGIINAYLTSAPGKRESSEDFASRLIHEVGVSDVGGFSLMFGELRPAENGTFPGLSILSNRSASAEDLTQIARKPGETHGLSNSHFGDMSWPKVVHGEQLLKEAIATSVQRKESHQDDFIEHLFAILTVDTIPQRKPDEDWEEYVRHMRNSIFIPPTSGPSVDSKPADEIASASSNEAANVDRNVQLGKASYGTQRQTVILVHKSGRVTFVERMLYGDDHRSMSKDQGQRKIEFDIEGWDSGTSCSAPTMSTL